MAATSGPAARKGSPDGVAVATLTLAAFLTVLALMAWQVRSAPDRPARRVVVVRRVYETRVVETVLGGSPRGDSVTQSVAGGGAQSSVAPATSTTRSS